MKILVQRQLTRGTQEYAPPFCRTGQGAALCYLMTMLRQILYTAQEELLERNIDKPCPQSPNTQTRGLGAVPIMQWVIDPLLHDHVGLPHVLVLAVHLVHLDV